MLSYSFWCHIRWGWTAGWVWGGGEWGYSWLIRSSLFRRWKEHRASLAGCPCLIIQTHPLSDSHRHTAGIFVSDCTDRNRHAWLPITSKYPCFYLVTQIYSFSVSRSAFCTLLKALFSSLKVTRGWSHQPALLASKLWVLVLINIPIKSQENLNPKRTEALDFLIKRGHTPDYL